MTFSLFQSAIAGMIAGGIHTVAVGCYIYVTGNLKNRVIVAFVISAIVTISCFILGIIAFVSES